MKTTTKIATVNFFSLATNGTVEERAKRFDTVIKRVDLSLGKASKVIAAVQAEMPVLLREILVIANSDNKEFNGKFDRVASVANALSTTPKLQSEWAKFCMGVIPHELAISDTTGKYTLLPRDWALVEEEFRYSGFNLSVRAIEALITTAVERRQAVKKLASDIKKVSNKQEKEAKEAAHNAAIAESESRDIALHAANLEINRLKAIEPKRALSVSDYESLLESFRLEKLEEIKELRRQAREECALRQELEAALVSERRLNDEVQSALRTELSALQSELKPANTRAKPAKTA